MLRIAAILLLLLGFAAPVCSQTIYSADREDSWQFRYVSSRKSNRYNNQVINQLALAQRKIPEKTAYTFFFNYNIAISYGYDNRLEVVFTLHPSICSGDVFMRDFDLSPVLVPPLATFEVQLDHPIDGRIAAFAVRNVRLDSLAGKYVAGSFPDSLWKEGCRAAAVFSDFSFDEAAYQKAERELFHIRDYEAASAMADTLENRIRRARVSRHTAAEALSVSAFSLKAAGLLKEASSVKSVILPGRDPLGLAAKQRVAAFRTQELVGYLLAEGIRPASIGNVYLNVQKEYAKGLSYALRLSQQVDYYSSPFFYRLYSNGISASQVCAFRKVVEEYARRHKTGNPDLAMLSRRIAGAYVSVADELIEKDRYAEAVDLLSAGVRFCAVNPALAEPERLTARLREARSGLTAAYIRVVKKALRNNLPVIAEKYLSEAEKYVQKYGLEDEEATGLTALYQQMTDMHISSAAAALQKERYDAALTDLDKAYGISQQHKNIVLGQSYTQGMRKAVNGRFREMTGQVRGLLRSGNHRAAGEKLAQAVEFTGNYPVYQPDQVLIDSLRRVIAVQEYGGVLAMAQDEKRERKKEQFIIHMTEAAGLARDFGFEHAVLFDSLVSGGVVSYLNELYSTGRLKLWAGEPDEALAISQRAAQLAALFSVSGHPALRKQHDELVGLADESLCSRIRGTLESLIGQADELLKNNRFDHAAEVVYEARELIYTHSYCGLSTRELNLVTERHGNAIRWNDMHKTALRMIAAGEFNDGVNKLKEAESVYNYFRLDTLGLSNSGLFELASGSDNLALVRYATGYFISRGNPDQALVLLEKLRLAGMGIDEANPLQESLARELAQRDRAETDEVNLKLMLRIYTGGNKWYKRFTDVYRYHIQNQ